MGMPKTKAECESDIAHLKREIEGYKARIATAKVQKNPGWQNVVAQANGQIAYCKGKIAQLQAHKKSLK